MKNPTTTTTTTKGDINWPAVKAQDEKLVKASEDLAKLRWTYTLGQTPKVSFAKYARETGVGLEAVRRYATAWEITLQQSDSPSDDPRGPEVLPIEKALNRAMYSTDRADVIEAVADARGISPASVRGTGHMDEVKAIEAEAREKAQEKGTTVREEAERIAQRDAKWRRIEVKNKTNREANPTGQFIELTGLFAKAKGVLTQALKIDAPNLDSEHVELLASRIGGLRALLELVEMKFINSVTIDWDAELANLKGPA